MFAESIDQQIVSCSIEVARECAINQRAGGFGCRESDQRIQDLPRIHVVFSHDSRNRANRSLITIAPDRADRFGSENRGLRFENKPALNQSRLSFDIGHWGCVCWLVRPAVSIGVRQWPWTRKSL